MHKYKDTVFCDLFGSDEKANRLMRRFIPKGANIAAYSEQHIKDIEQWMNNYPRKLLTITVLINAIGK